MKWVNQFCHFSFTQTHSQNDELKSNAKDVIACLEDTTKYGMWTEQQTKRYLHEGFRGCSPNGNEILLKYNFSLANSLMFAEALYSFRKSQKFGDNVGCLVATENLKENWENLSPDYNWKRRNINNKLENYVKKYKTKTRRHWNFPVDHLSLCLAVLLY